MQRQRHLLALAVGIALAWGASPVPPADAADPAFSAEQQQQIERLVQDYLLKNPEVIIESVRQYQTKMQAEADQQAKTSLASNRARLENDGITPVWGNPKGDVTIVEFFDYNCGYCKRVVPSVQELLRSDSNIRYVFKEMPILRKDSLTAAQAALAVWMLAPEKYFDFHAALMGVRGELSDEKIRRIAADLGIPADKLTAKMQDPKIDEAIRQNLDLGRILGVNGTPAFIIGDKIVPGAIDLKTMRQMVTEARGAG